MRKNARRLNLSFDNLDRRAVPSSMMVGPAPDGAPATESGDTSGDGGGMQTRVKVYGNPSAGSSTTSS